ncbi:MAG: hypothetical protein QXW06_08400, partial [Thermoplasmata archaeon]
QDALGAIRGALRGPRGTRRAALQPRDSDKALHEAADGGGDEGAAGEGGVEGEGGRGPGGGGRGMTEGGA